jgi:hypothetical protein
MAKGDAGGSKSGTAKTEEKAAEKTAAGTTEATDEKVATEKSASSEKPAKQEKTYTKAEVELERQKAIDEAKKKFEEEKDLSETERLKKENEELRAANRLRDAKDTAIDALTKAGARSPELLWKTLQGDIEFADDGKIKNLDTLVTGLKTDYADMFGEAKPDTTVDGGAGQGGGGGAKKFTKEAIEKMSTKEINENWEEVSKALAASQ